MRRLIDNIEAIPGVPVVTFVDGEGHDVATVDFGSLGVVARQIAGRLRGEARVERGDRALMLYTPSLEFVHALAGCLVAGVVPVPVCPPDPFNLRREMGRLRAIVQDCSPKVALCNAEYAQVRDLGDLGTGGDRGTTVWPELQWLQTDDSATDAGFDPVAIRDDELAVLQYTSGSTGDPKGVAITHANVEHQCELNRRRLGLTPESRAVFWVPHYHDFGLISGIMNAFSGQGHIRLLSPLSFVARPSVWFDVLSRVHGTHTASPNFGYELIIARSTPEQRAGWDLSSLRVAMSAAEPINPATVQRLREVFAPCGFRADAFCPSYGLAEHTVGVTMAGVAEIAFDELRLEDEGIAQSAESGLAPGRRARTIVGCGRPVEVDVRIVDPDTCAELPSARVGEIWVDSPSKAAGYWGRAEESAATFRASLSDGDGLARYLRTGDMGFLYDGELFITGRRSEMLIVRGRNIFPQDVEATVIAAHERIRPGGAVAFALKTRSDLSDDEVEGVGLVVEVRKSNEAPAPELLDEIGRAVERAVNELHGVNPARVTVCRPGAVAKTSSGKRKRAATRDALLAGELDRDGLVLADRGGEVEAPAARAAEVEPEYERLIADTARQFALMAGASPRRLFHPRATTLRGRLRVLPLASPDLDATAIFSTGAEYPVIVRHANGVTDDDAAWDNRGATVRVLPAGRPEDLDAPLLDLLLTTGARFTSATAADFVAWMAAGRAQREDIVRRSPHLGTAAWETFRLPDAYNHVHYHSKVASRYRTVDARELLIRYRLIDPEHPEDGGRLEPDGLLPPDRAGRPPGETRSARFLHERLRSDVAAGGLRYLLQVQLRPHDEAALDATRTWEEPWLDRAELLLTEIVDDARVEPLTFNPANAPEPLGLVPATRSTEPASLNHLRSIVYAAAAERRKGAPAPKRVAVIGGGVSGLTAARELERRGHKVVVLERSGEVGGKARSIELDGLPFDLGAHLCSRGYERLGVLLRELGIGTEDVSEVILWSLEAGGARSFQDPALRGEFLRYQQLKRERFPDVAVPGLAHGGAELDRPARDFFAEHDLHALGRITSLGYTASGYGFLADDAVSAHRVLKYAEVATLCMPRDELSFWTPKGGFGNVWRKVADGLADVRLNCRVEAIRAHEDRALVETGDGRLEVDAVVLACQPHELGDVLQRDGAPADARHIPYATVVARASGLPRDGFFLVDDHLGDPSTAGHVVAFHHRYPESDVYLFWAYIDAEADDEAVLSPVRDDIARMGGTLDEAVSIHRWDYAPHLPLPASAAHAEVEASQGRDGIFWVGSLHNFELVETNMRYALHVAELVDRRLTGGAATAPEATAPVLATTNGDTVGSLVDYLVGELSRVLRRPAESFAPEHHLLDLGLDSVHAVEIFEAIGRDTGIELAPLAMYEHSTIQALAAHLAELSGETVAGPAAPTVAHGLDPRRSVHDQLMDAEGEATRAALLLDLIITVSAERLGVTRESIDVQAGITEFGLDSLKSVELFEAVLERAGLSLPPAVLVEHPTFAGLAQRLAVEFARAYPAARSAAAPPADAQPGLVPGRTVFDRLMEAAGEAARAALLLDLIVTLTAERIAVTRESIDVRAGIAEFGLDSVKSVEVFEAVLARSRLSLPPAVIVEHPTFAGLAQRLAVEFARAHPTARTAAEPPVGAELSVLTTRVGRIEGVLEDMRAQLAVLAGGAVTNGGGPAQAAVLQDDPSPWVRRHRRSGQAADLSLVCFHSAGLDAPMYDPWADRMPDGVELCAVRLPGRGAHSGTSAATMDELLPMLRTALEPWLDRRFAFFGHSFGALTAYAMTRYLRDCGDRLPVRLIVAGFWAPDCWVSRPELTAMMEGKVAPGLTLDQRIMDSWVYQPGPPLSLPISVFAGAHDLLVKRDDVDRWSEQSATSTDLHIVPGGHFQLVTDPLVIHTVNSLMSIDLSASAPPPQAAVPPPEAAVQPAPAVLRPSFAPLEDAEAAWMTRLDERFAQPADTRGSWNLWDLINVARVRSDDPEFPACPEALDLLVSMLDADGTFGDWRSPFPYNNFVLAMATLSTLLQWHGRGERDYASRFDALDRRIVVEDQLRRRDDIRGIDLPYGKYFKFPGMFGESMIPAFEADRLLRFGRDVVSGSTRAVLESLATEDVIGSVERYFRFGQVALPFAELYPEDAIRSDRVREFAKRCFSTAFAARFFDVMRTPEARATFEHRLEGDLIGGLRPEGKLQEVLFSLLYLSKAGVDLTTYCPQAMEYLRDVQRPYGVGLDEHYLNVDVDSTAIAMIVSAEQGVPCVVERGSSVLEGMWDDDRGYRSTWGYFFNTVMLLWGAQATLRDPGATAEQQRAVWEHTLEHLDRRQWLSVDHISPLYLWETAVSFLFEFEHRFPDLPTRHHHEVLDLVLSLQVPSGGFRSYLFDEPDPEETALGLLALKAALAGDLTDEQRERVSGAVDRAQSWLAPRFAAAAAAEEHHYPEEWIGVLTFVDPKLSESILAASLLKEPRGRWAVGAHEADLAATP